MDSTPRTLIIFCMIEIRTMVWALELVSFMLVDAILLFVVPSSIFRAISFWLVTITEIRPSAEHRG